MKKLLVVLAILFGLTGSALAQQYGSLGGSVEGREYWFNNDGAKKAFDKDLTETIKRRDRFQSCDLQKVLLDRRWQTCRKCGFVTKNSFPNLASSWPVECM